MKLRNSVNYNIRTLINGWKKIVFGSPKGGYIHSTLIFGLEKWVCVNHL